MYIFIRIWLCPKVAPQFQWILILFQWKKALPTRPSERSFAQTHGADDLGDLIQGLSKHGGSHETHDSDGDKQIGSVCIVYLCMYICVYIYIYMCRIRICELSIYIYMYTNTYELHMV